MIFFLKYIEFKPSNLGLKSSAGIGVISTGIAEACAFRTDVGEGSAAVAIVSDFVSLVIISTMINKTMNNFIKNFFVVNFTERIIRVSKSFILFTFPYLRYFKFAFKLFEFLC